MYEFISAVVALCASVSILGQFTYVRVCIKALENYAGGTYPLTAKIILYIVSSITYFFLAPFVLIASLTGPSQESINEFCETHSHVIEKNNS